MPEPLSFPTATSSPPTQNLTQLTQSSQRTPVYPPITAELSTLIRSAIAGRRVRETKQAGVGDVPFLDVPEAGSLLVAFNVSYLDRHLRVTVTPTSVTYTLQAGAPITLRHHGQPLTVTPGAPVARAIPGAPACV